MGDHEETVWNPVKFRKLLQKQQVRETKYSGFCHSYSPVENMKVSPVYESENKNYENFVGADSGSCS